MMYTYNLAEGKIIEPASWLDICLVKAEPLQAVLDDNYFIECVKKCEANWHTIK